MNRKQITEKIVKVVSNEEPLEIKLINSANHHKDDYKNGLYFLLNKEKEVIYVGLVSDAKTASLYMRLIGNGSGAHSMKDWYSEVEFVKFHKFPYENEQLKIAERLAIQKLCPVYNDVATDQKTLDKYHNEW